MQKENPQLRKSTCEHKVVAKNFLVNSVFMVHVKPIMAN